MDVVVMPVDQLRTLLVEACSIALRHNHQPTNLSTAEPYGDFQWLCATLTTVPASTLRIKSAAGEIPGTKKIGKRVLYEKAVVLNWLHEQRYVPRPKAEELDEAAEVQFTAQHNRRGGRKAA